MAGDTTACAKAVASAASIADPPARNISPPAAAASGSGQTTMRFGMAPSGRAVACAERLHVGESAVAQPRDVAAGVHELVAALEHVDRCTTGMRHGAHRAAGAANGLLGAVEQRGDLGVLE